MSAVDLILCVGHVASSGSLKVLSRCSGFLPLFFATKIVFLLDLLQCICCVFRTSRDRLHELHDALVLEGVLLANDSRSYSSIYRLVLSLSFVLFCLYDETHHTFSGTSYVRDRSS